MPTQKIWQGFDTAFIYADTHCIFSLEFGLVKKNVLERIFPHNLFCGFGWQQQY